jgi:predicted nucleotidyltransferase
MQSVIEENKQKIDEICRKYKVSNLEVFGSASTGQFDETRSDIDFLVEFLPDVVNERFDNFFALLDELTKLFNRPVDLVEPGGLRNPYLIRRINQTRRRIYASS